MDQSQKLDVVRLGQNGLVALDAVLLFQLQLLHVRVVQVVDPVAIVREHNYLLEVGQVY